MADTTYIISKEHINALNIKTLILNFCNISDEFQSIIERI